MKRQSTYVFESTNTSPGFFLAGLGGVDPDVRKRAEKIKSKYLLENGETLLERMKEEVPRRINYQSTGASHIPDLVAYYNLYNADPQAVAQAFKSDFPDLFPGGINARYNSDGSVDSDPGSSGSVIPPAITTAGIGTNPWVIGAGILILGGAAFAILGGKKRFS